VSPSDEEIAREALGLGEKWHVVFASDRFQLAECHTIHMKHDDSPEINIFCIYKESWRSARDRLTDKEEEHAPEVPVPCSKCGRVPVISDYGYGLEPDALVTCGGCHENK
jgi:hypothetical protein